MLDLLTRLLAKAVAKFYGFQYETDWFVPHPKGAVTMKVLKVRGRPFGFDGVTFGRYLVTRVTGYMPCFAIHEATHYHQWRKYGVFFPFLYAFESLIGIIKGKGAYMGNRFEEEARMYEDDCLPT